MKYQKDIPESPDELTRLEKLQSTMHRERKAWKKLLDNLETLRVKNAKQDTET